MSNNNLKKKIFPLTENIDNLKYDQEGLWSITHPEQADKISNLIKNHFYKNNKKKYTTILDATAGIGGNLISFCRYFNFVYGIEICENRFEILKNNIETYNFSNVSIINQDCLNYFDVIKADIVFFDPPWGGPDYKFNPKIEIKIGNKRLSDIVEILENKAKLICIKLPLNFNMTTLVNRLTLPIFDYKFKNMRLIIIDL